VDIENLIIQLGISGAVLVVGYRLAGQLIRHWREVEDKRSDVLERKLAAIVDKVDEHHTADLESHAAMAAQLARIETRQDFHSETPARGVRLVRTPTNNGDKK
jgi:hypothetical protein